MKNVPKIRFKGFTDAWELRKLGDVADIVGGGTPNTNNKLYWNGNINWYSPTEISDQTYLESSQRKISDIGYKNCSAKILPKGTVLFTSRAGIGKTAILLKEGCTNQGFQSIVPHKNSLDSYFIFSRSLELKKYAETVGAGSTFIEVSRKQMHEMKLMLPTFFEEQKNIGIFFKNIDNLITLHQRKCEQLKTLKKFLLQKMFPENGNEKPELRFTGFTDAWEQRKVTDIGKIFIGLVTTMTENYANKGTLLIRNSDIQDGQFVLKENPIYLKNSFAETNKSRRHKLGDIITVHTGDVGTSAVISENEVNSIGFATIVTRPNNKLVDSNFICSFLNTHKHKSIALKLSTGDGRTNYNLKDYSKLEVPICSLREQQKLANIITTLSNLITLHQRKCEELKKVKQYLLQNMFPQE
ncbi:EcoKI restriction-modification system protein HsdS [Anaerobiospirillum thomasii]|uniref:restriction endonuclease subunit S n=1 Tax=Anaerobiospirillum thomasii TaxID=179995 RepID=UPI000D910E91|nr:restriction endonuclease subunit S [Anaerobiospirillum thomasii]SPT71818.1 EcoKI restriction-modification system protein HsdS [Anaerobiospirillum thomasii]